MKLMKNTIKRIVATISMVGMLVVTVFTPMRADAADRTLTSADIPDKSLYNAMVAVGDFDGNGQITESEALAISSIQIKETIADFKGLELCNEDLLVNFIKDDGSFSTDEIKTMIGKLSGYSNVKKMSIESGYVDEAMYEEIAKLPLTMLSACFSPGFNFSIIGQGTSSEKPIYNTLNYFRLYYPDDAAYIDVSMESFEKFSALNGIDISGAVNIKGVDKVSRHTHLMELKLSGRFDEGAVMDLAGNTDLQYIEIMSTGDKKPTVKIGTNVNLATVYLTNVVLVGKPKTASIFSAARCNLDNMSTDFSECVNLNSLYISECNLKEITGLNNCTGLTYLSLPMNNLSKIPDFRKENFTRDCTLDFSGNNLTKEEFLAKTPECFYSDIQWLYTNMAGKVVDTDDQIIHDVYKEFDTTYFDKYMDSAPAGDLAAGWNTNCSEIVIKKTILQKATSRPGMERFEFTYVDEVGNRILAYVNLEDALKKTNGDVVIKFDFSRVQGAESKWNTTDVYADLHRKFFSSEATKFGVTYEYNGSSSYNVYTDPNTSVKRGVDFLDIANMVKSGQLPVDKTYYFIPITSDTNYRPGGDIGINAGKMNIKDEGIEYDRLDCNMISAMPNNSSVNMYASFLGSTIRNDVWKLICEKNISVNIYIVDSTFKYVDIVATFSKDNVSETNTEGNDSIAVINFASNNPNAVIRDGLTKYMVFESVFTNKNTKIKAYVGDIAKNGETVCIVEEYTYVNDKNCSVVGYKIINEYTVVNGMIEMSCQPNKGLVSMRNKNNVSITIETGAPPEDEKEPPTEPVTEPETESKTEPEEENETIEEETTSEPNEEEPTVVNTVTDEIIDNLTSTDDNIVEVMREESVVIGKEVFEAIINEGKNITYGVVDKNNKLKYSWSFSPKHITDTDKTMDLTVEILDTHEKVEKKLQKEEPLYIEFKHHGSLPGDATIKIHVGDKYAGGEKLQLYYYDEAQDVVLKVGKNLLAVDEKGFIEFTISHCSTYFVLEEAEANDFNEANEIQLDKESHDDINFNITDTEEEQPDIEDNNKSNPTIFIVLGVVLILVIAGATVYFILKKNRKTE